MFEEKCLKKNLSKQEKNLFCKGGEKHSVAIFDNLTGPTSSQNFSKFPIFSKETILVCKKAIFVTVKYCNQVVLTSQGS